MALPEMASAPELLTQRIRKQLLAQARSGEVVMLDVRPQSEFDAAHLPHARSMPLPELARRLSELPRDVEIVAYCRGPFCLMSGAAVTLLRAHGFQARKTLDGISDWLVAGLSLSRACASSGMATHHPKDPAMPRPCSSSTTRPMAKGAHPPPCVSPPEWRVKRVRTPIDKVAADLDFVDYRVPRHPGIAHSRRIRRRSLPGSP